MTLFDINNFEQLEITFKRDISIYDRRFILSHFKDNYNIEMSWEDIETILKLINHVSKNIQGRLAGDSIDLLILFLYRYHASLQFMNFSTRLNHVEIGTLFGGSAIISMKAINSVNHNANYIMIDPLDSYYGKDKDYISNHSISIDYVKKNLDFYDLQSSNYEIFNYFSNDPIVHEKFKSIEIATLFIDGDHTYEGIKKDWNMYFPLVVDNGYIIIDNYNDIYWPEVTRFVNDELLSGLNTDWKVELIYGKTIVLKKIGTTLKNITEFSLEFSQLKGQIAKIQQALSNNEGNDKSKIFEFDEKFLLNNLQILTKQMKIIEALSVANNALNEENAEYTQNIEKIEQNINMIKSELEKYEILKSLIVDVSKISILKNPIRKIKNYKQMVFTYQNMFQ